MVQSIKQNAARPVLPSFNQLGVLLRVLVLVNGAMLVFALTVADSWVAWPVLASAAAARVEPVLLTILLGLIAAHKLLIRMTYRVGLALVLAWSVLVPLFVLPRLMPMPPFAVQQGCLLSIAATLMVAGYFRLRQQALSPAIAEARLQALQARIRPHFLFNSLNAAVSLVRVDPRRAERVLENLADLFRVLMADNRQLVKLEDEVELARHYLEIEEVRLGPRLQVQWHTDKMPVDALIPPLVLQPLLENAVYHGIEPSIEPGTIQINLYRRRNEVFVVIRNPYRGDGNHHAGNKMALSNIRERLLLHFDVDAELSTRVGTDYYQVMIRMPYQHS